MRTALIASTALFESVYRAIPIPLLLLETNSPDFTIVAINDAACQTTGRSASALMGQPIFTAFPDNPYDSAATGVTNLQALLIKTIETKEQQSLKGLKYEIRRANEESFEVRYWDITSTPIADDSTGQIRYILLTGNDVTQQFLLKERTEKAERDKKESLQRLESVQEKNIAAGEANALLHAIINAAQAGIFLFSPVYNGEGKVVDFRFRIVNRTLADYFGQTPDAIRTRLGSEWLSGYKSNGLFETLRHTAETGESKRFEFHYKEDGLNVWLDIMSTKVNGDVLVTFTDFTAMKNLQRRLEEHVAELRSSNINLEQFAYVASHDLQEPLRKVKSFGDMLQNRYEEALGPSGADLIARMQSAAARMGTLIDDLLTYSRASVKPAEMKLIDTNKVLDGVLLDLERVIQQQKAVITKSELLPVAGQATQIGQVFLNLISNALKFHKADAAPEISISSEIVQGKDSGLSISVEDNEKLFQLIRVTDNGIGFDNSYRDQIFQIFQRLNNRSDFPGSGVGLSIVKKVVSNHNGYIEAGSELGKGTTFFVLLPYAGSEV